MVARTELAILDHNSNLERPQARTAEGIPRFNAVFPKRTQEWVAKVIREKSHSWRNNLTEHVVKLRMGQATADNIPIQQDIPRNIATKERPAKEEIVQKHLALLADGDSR